MKDDRRVSAGFFPPSLDEFTARYDDRLSRRTFLGLTGLGALAALDLGLGSLPGIHPRFRHSELPDELGRGFLSTGEISKGLVVDLSASKPERTNQGSIEFSAKLAESRTTYAKRVAGSARAKFRGTIYSAKGNAAASSEFRSEKRRMHVVLVKHVTTEEHFLREPVLNAAAGAETSAFSFLDRYGDLLIRKVALGGELIVVYTLEYDRESQARESSGSLDLDFQVGGGGATFHSKLIRRSAARRITMGGYCRGVKAMPRLIGRHVPVAVGAQAAASKSDSAVAELLEFWDNFEEIVRDDGVATPVAFDFMPITQVGQAIPIDRESLQVANAAISTAERLDDLIDSRLADLAYLKDACMQWNRHVSLSEIASLEQALKPLATELREWAAKAMQEADLSGRRLEPPFLEASIPSIPESWICRDLQRRGTYQSPRLINTQIRERVAIPVIHPEQHIAIRGSIVKFGGDPLRLTLGFDIGGQIASWNFSNTKRAVDIIVQPPPGAGNLILKGATYGSDPSIIDLSIWA